MVLGIVGDVARGMSRPLPQYGNTRMLTRVGDTHKMYDNVCPHQGSLIIDKMQQEISCQYHGWSWDNNGSPTGHGSTRACNRATLEPMDVFETNGMLFDALIDLSYLNINFNNFFLDGYRTDIVHASALTIMDVFLDVDHIPVVHKDVYEVIGIEGAADVEWDYFSWGSVQKVRGKTENEWAAVWIAVNHHTMIEWQPGALFITVCLPAATTNVTPVGVWKYYEKDSPDSLRQLNSDIWERAWYQDKHQASQLIR